MARLRRAQTSASSAESSSRVEKVSRHAPIVHSVRVDKVGRSAQILRFIRAIVVVVITLIMLIPVFWMVLTVFKSHPDAIAVPPKVFFKPRLVDSFVFLLTDRFCCREASWPSIPTNAKSPGPSVFATSAQSRDREKSLPGTRVSHSRVGS